MSEKSRRGAIEEIEIRDIAFGGDGVGTLADGKSCFVPFVIPGERAAVRVTKSTARYAQAELVRLTKVSPERVKPVCPYFGACGGCSYQHMPYVMQVHAKERQLFEILRRLAAISNPPLEPMVTAGKPFGYRNRITVHTLAARTGFYRRNSHILIDIDACPIASEAVNEKLRALRASGPREGACTLREHDSRQGFHQTNDAAADLLLAVVKRFASGSEKTLIDAYSGSGFFAHGLRDEFDKVIGIEWNEAAVKAARVAATDRETYLVGDVAAVLPEALRGEKASDTLVLLDPPAQGVSGDVITAIRNALPARLIYVSCNPTTLARDLKKLLAEYALYSVTPIDMFPQTAGIESVVAMRRRSPFGA